MKRVYSLLSVLFIFLMSTSTSATPRFVEHVIEGSFSGAVSLHVLDMDDDDDLDIVACGVYGNYISWFEQLEGMQFIEHPVASDVNAVYSVAAADFNEDGLIDIASAAFTGARVDVWLQQNDGTFTGLPLATGYNRAHTVEVADMNDDGHIDLLSMGGGNMPLRLYENDGTANFTLFPLHELNYRGQSCRPIDMDGDDDLDILSNNFDNGRFNLFRNDGEDNYTAELIGFIDGAHWIIGADIDGDGSPDPVTAAYLAGQISWWWINFGIWNRTTIDDQLSTAVYVEAADFDLDGDVDLVASSEAGSRLVWYENDATTFTSHVLDNAFLEGAEVFPVDLDQDGDTDIVAASKGLNDIVWWELESIQPPSTFDLLQPVSGGTINTEDSQFFEWTESTDDDPGAEVVYSLHLGCAVAPGDTSWLVFDDIASLQYQVMSYDLWPDVEAGDYEGVVYVAALSQNDVVVCNNPTDVHIEIAGNAVGEGLSDLPVNFELLPAHPNPFNAMTTVSVALPEPSRLMVSVYTVEGRRVATLVDGPMTSGVHSFAFDGAGLASGIYLVTAQIPDKSMVMQKLALVK